MKDSARSAGFIVYRPSRSKWKTEYSDIFLSTYDSPDARAHAFADLANESPQFAITKDSRDRKSQPSIDARREMIFVSSRMWMIVDDRRNKIRFSTARAVSMSVSDVQKPVIDVRERSAGTN